MAARGSQVMQYVPSEVCQSANPPANPVPGQLWRNASVTPNELLAWTGNSANIARRYAASKSGAAVSFYDLSDDRTLDVVVKTVASQAGGGAASPGNVRPIQGKTSGTIFVGGNGKTLTPSAALYGLTGYEDEIGNGGRETHKTNLVTRDGSADETITCADYYATKPNSSIFVMDGFPNALNLVSSLCDRAIVMPVWNVDVEGYYQDSTNPARIQFRILKSRLAGWSDTWTDVQKVAALRTWLAANPVSILYPLSTPTTYANAATPITGEEGINTVTSDGVSVSVSYTGSGWAALGAVQRVAVESVSITPEQGLRVDTVLQSSDGAHQVPTYFNARGAKYGLFRASDGVMILGGMVLPNGQPAGVAGALVSPEATGETRIEIETTSEGSGQTRVDTAALHLVQPSLEGATDGNPAPTGEKVPIWFEAVRTTLVDGTGHYIDNYNGAIKALDSLQLIALSEGGQELAWMMLEHTPEGGLLHTGGAYSASDPERTLSNFAPRIQMSAPTSESIVYNATARRYMLDWKTIEDDYGRFETFKGGNLSARNVGIVIQVPGYYRFVFHVDLEQASSSSGAVMHINRMPPDWMPPSNRDYCTDADLTPSSGPTRIAYRRAASAPLNASTTTCELVAEMWCADGEKILPVAAVAAASKTLVSAGTFFSAQKIG